jgi:IS5 family transposase
VLIHAEIARLLSDEHFTVDGTLLDSESEELPAARSGPASDAGGNASVNFRGQRRGSATHQSTTDPDARLYKKATGQPARLGYLGHVLMEHRSGLIVNATVTAADGYGEREAALAMISGLGGRRCTVAADKGYDSRDFVAQVRALGATPHVAQFGATGHRGSAIDGRTTRHAGYRFSQQKRKLVEQGFGWMKTVGGLRSCGTAGDRW